MTTSLTECAFKHLTVIGLGLIGGSVAMAARERFPDLHIQGVDPNAEALQYALKHQIIDQASLTLPDTYEEAHLVVIAAHLSSSLRILSDLAPRVQGRNVLVTDIGSCKRKITALGKALLPTQFIAGHPMAGKELSGIQNATSLLFSGKAYLLCPHEETPESLLENLQGFISALGGKPKRVNAEQHDAYMAYVSHLPQMYAVLLTNLLYRHEPGRLLSYHGGGLDDQLRLAASPSAMWGDVFRQNGDNLKQVLTELKGLIDEALPLLEEPPVEGEARTSDTDPWKPWFDRSNEIQKQFQQMRVSR